MVVHQNILSAIIFKHVKQSIKPQHQKYAWPETYLATVVSACGKCNSVFHKFCVFGIENGLYRYTRSDTSHQSVYWGLGHMERTTDTKFGI